MEKEFLEADISKWKSIEGLWDIGNIWKEFSGNRTGQPVKTYKKYQGKYKLQKSVVVVVVVVVTIIIIIIRMQVILSLSYLRF